MALSAQLSTFSGRKGALLDGKTVLSDQPKYWPGPDKEPSQALCQGLAALSVKHGAFLSQTEPSKVCKGPSQKNTGPLRSTKCHPRATQGPLRPTECSLGQTEGLHRLIKSTCRPTEFPLRPKQGYLGQYRAWSVQQRIFSQHHRKFLSQTQPCCSLRPANGALGPIQGQLRPTTDPSEQQGARSGRQNVLLIRKGAL